MPFSTSKFKFSTLVLLLLSPLGCGLLEPYSNGYSSNELKPFSVSGNLRSSWVTTKTMTHTRDGFGGYFGSTQLDLLRPVAVAVSDGVFYIVDAGRDQLIRFDSVSQQGKVIMALSQYAVGEITDIYLYDRRFLLLADPQGSQVLKLSLQGELLQRLKAPGALRSPVAIAADYQRNEILVADGGFDHVVIFTEQGQAIATIGERGMDDGELRSVTSLLWTNEGLYVSMRPGGRIQLFDVDGVFQKRLHAEDVLFPNAMAVDRYGRLYVSDLMANDIKVYQQGRLLKVLGGAGVASGLFQRITDLWVDQDTLYVVDSLNGRIQSQLIYK